MKKIFSHFCFVVIATLGISSVTFADSAPALPNCSLKEKYDYDLQVYKPSKSICKAINRILMFSLSKEFEDKILLLDKIYNIDEIANPDDGGYFYTVHDTNLQDSKHAPTPEIVAINKAYLDSKRGLKGIFTEEKTKKKDEYDQVYTKMSPRNKKEFSENSFPVVIFASDQDFAKYEDLEIYGPDQDWSLPEMTRTPYPGHKGRNSSG